MRRRARFGVVAAAVLATAACTPTNPIQSITNGPPDHLSLYRGAKPVGTIYVAAGGRIWRIRGGAVDTVTPAGKTYSYPAVSPDGRHSAATLIGKGHSEIALGGPDFANLQPLTVPPANILKSSLDLKPSFAPDGARLVFMSDRSAGFSDEQIWEGSFAPYRPTQVTCPPDSSGGDDAPTYLAGGQLLLFTQWRLGHAQVSEKKVLSSCLAQSGQPKVLLQKDGEDYMDPAAGPPGKIAYVHRLGEVANLEVADNDGTASVPLTTFGNVRQAGWSPDGANLLFISNRAGTFDLWMVAVDGKSAPVRLTWGGDLDANSRPAWVG